MQLDNVGSVALQFDWRVVVDSFTAVQTESTSPTDTPRPATARSLLTRADDNIRPSSALSHSTSSHVLFCSQLS